MEWFREAFDGHYLTLYARRDRREAKRQVELLLKQLHLPDGALVLDLGCGSGRHAVELNRRGCRVVCLDLSFQLLRLVGRSRQQPLWKLQADMREVPLRGPFDAVFSFFTSFGYFDDVQDDRRVLAEVARVLRPGGIFVLDLLNPAHVRSNLVPYSEEVRHGIRIRQWRSFNPVTQRVEKQVILHTGGTVKRIRESVRCYSLSEIRRLLEQSGLQVESVYGDFDGQVFTERSPRLITISRA